MDLLCRCVVSVSTLICGGVCFASMFCRYRIVVCIPLVLRVRAGMGGWVYSCVAIGSICSRDCCVVFGIWVFRLWDGVCGSLVSGFGCVAFELVLACVVVWVGVHPLHWLMCNCALFMCTGRRLVRMRVCVLLVGCGRGGLRVYGGVSVLCGLWLWVLLACV
jgi:hypothetical protein